MKRFLLLFTILFLARILSAQLDLHYLGLANENLSALDINFGLLVVGTDRNGVHWQYEGSASDTGWTEIAMDSSVQTVYPHKSGPLGWTISVGIQPADGKPPFVFCSYLGEDFVPMSDGIHADATTAIWELDGFPDPSICGETYAVADRDLFRRNYGDTTWHSVYGASIEGNLQTVKVRQAYPGVVLAGGADGFAGILLIKSLNFGETWEDISPFGMISDIDFSGAAADTIFATASNRIFRTTNGGDDWTPVVNDAAGVHLTEIVFDAESHSVYAAGTTIPDDRGVIYVSHDLGDNWTEYFPDDLGAILGLEEGSDDWIYLITRDEGVFRFRGITSAIDEVDLVDDIISLKPISPNPFGQWTSIEFTLRQSEDVLIRVFTLSGNMITTLAKGRMSAGEHRIIWEADHLSDGVYVVMLEVNGRRVHGRVEKMSDR